MKSEFLFSIVSSEQSYVLDDEMNKQNIKNVNKKLCE